MGSIENNSNSMNEIVFENRNKAYGAYLIRRSYDDSLIKSFSLAMLVLLGLIAFYHFMPVKKDSFPPPPNNEGVVVNLKPEKEKKIIEIPKPKMASSTPKREAPTVPLFEDSTKLDPPKKEEPSKSDDLANKGKPGDSTGYSSGAGGKGNDSSAIEVLPAKKEVQRFVDEMPEFPGGDMALMRYMKNNIRFTQQAIDAGINGKMLVQFVVDEEGVVRNVEILNKLGFGLEKQATNVLLAMPRWKPGKMGGKAVPVYHVQQIKYELHE